MNAVFNQDKPSKPQFKFGAHSTDGKDDLRQSFRKVSYQNNSRVESRRVRENV